MSQAKQVLTTIADAADVVPGVTWGTAPEAVWFVDFASEELRARGLTALVLMPNGKFDFRTRGNISGDEVEVHVAVMMPRSAGDLNEGDAVVDAAEKVAKAFVGKSMGSGPKVNCVEASQEPVISGDYMRQNNLWVSYLKLTLKVVF